MATRLVVPVGLVRASVCSDEGPLVARDWLNAACPTGLGHGWDLSDDETFSGGEPNPCPCETDPSCVHYLFSC